MLLLFPCPGTIPAPSCWPSCQTSCCAPTLSGCAAAASSHLSTAPTQSCSVDPPPLHHQPPQGLHGSGPLAGSSQHRCWLPGKHPGGPAAIKRVSFTNPLVSSPSPSQAPPSNSPGTVFLVAEWFFVFPGQAAPSQSPQQRYSNRQRSLPQRLDPWPLLLPANARARGSPVETWLHPGWRSNQLVYCITLVQSLYISCYVSLNKLVLSFLLLRLLPQYPWLNDTRDQNAPWPNATSAQWHPWFDDTPDSTVWITLPDQMTPLTNWHPNLENIPSSMTPFLTDILTQGQTCLTDTLGLKTPQTQGIPDSVMTHLTRWYPQLSDTPG